MKIPDRFARLVANRRTFSLWQKLGLHVVPANYASPIPDTRELGPKTWSDTSLLTGIDMNEPGQMKLLAQFSRKFQAEYNNLTFDGKPIVENPYFSSVDVEVLYCMVRQFRPSRIVEIGSGYSTMISAAAILANKTGSRPAGELVAIEPYPKDFLLRGFRGLSRLINDPVQSVPISFFEGLRQNDIFFIDSSHIVKTGGDVCYEFLEILPRLRKGVIVHVHDIFLPSEYPEHQVMGLKYFYNEQYLLQAFLSFNTSFKVLWSGSFMHLRHPRQLREAFLSYDPTRNWPGSFWMQRTH